MTRINRAIELLEQGQPTYYEQLSGGGYDEGVKIAGTWADYLLYDMEHPPFQVSNLAAFMRGLVDGGPTRSGHRTPAVVVTLPTDGTNEGVIRANAWMMKQALATGVHGLLLCHAQTPEAVRAFVESCRFPVHRQGIGDGLGPGRRGFGGEPSASAIWGIPPAEYVQSADVWPLNPKGELMLGLKIEDSIALANSKANTRTPGITFAEWGPGDMGLSLGYPNTIDEPWPEAMREARSLVMSACKAAGIAFLDGVKVNNVVDRIKEGVMIGSGVREAAEIGRRHTGRALPW